MRPGIEIPPGIKLLPTDERGYPIPFFVSYVDNKPVFHLADARKAVQCHKEQLCWVCGMKLKSTFAFVGGPESCKFGSFADAPSHVECAEFSAKVCPYLVTPNAKRREDDLPSVTPSGFQEEHPKIIGVYETGLYQVVLDNGAFIYLAGVAYNIQWYHKGEICLPPEETHGTRD